MSRTRSIAIDVARGLVVVFMVQAHAFDGWVDEAFRQEAPYRFTRLLSLFPLPTFLLLAGVGMALRIESGLRRNEERKVIRASLVKRGLEVVASGYALNVVLGIIDEARSIETFLRVDVLHAIGASIALIAPLACASWVNKDALSSNHSPRVLGVVVFTAMTALSIPLTHWGRTLEGTSRFVLGLFVEVPDITRMPVVPLAAFLGAGLTLGSSLASLDKKRAFALCAFAAFIAALSFVAQETLVERIPGRFDRTHPAIVANLAELVALSIALVALVIGLEPSPNSRIVRWLELLGRHSLLAYAVHLPFAYGRIPKEISRSLSMMEAAVPVALLLVFTTLVVLGNERFEELVRRRQADKIAR